MPTVFAITDLVIGRPTMAIFTAFGSVTMLLFVDRGVCVAGAAARGRGRLRARRLRAGADRRAPHVLASGARLVDWYQQAARALAGAGDVPEPLPHDKAVDGRLIDAVRRDLIGEDGRGTATAVKMIWTAEHLDAARRLQSAVPEPAREIAAVERTPRSWLTGRRQEPSHEAGFSAGQ